MLEFVNFLDSKRLSSVFHVVLAVLSGEERGLCYAPKSGVKSDNKDIYVQFNKVMGLQLTLFCERIKEAGIESVHAFYPLLTLEGRGGRDVFCCRAHRKY